MDATANSNSGVWAPDVIAALNRAYAEACDMLESERADQDDRVKVAEHMMYLAQNGETDEGRLCSLSVIAVLGRKPASERSAGRASAGSETQGHVPLR